ncbi:MAG: glycoside hydrolase [Firmicutes bacterium]|nr:glycoside hydrolase [Bacillota bacterium]
MAENLVVYTVIHQPRRLRLPARPIPSGAPLSEISQAIFDDAMNRRYFDKVAGSCYHPACELFLRAAEEGFKLCIGFSQSFLQQAIAYDPGLLAKFKELAAHPNTELINVEPYHSLLFYLDIRRFEERMRWNAAKLERFFGTEAPVRVSDTTEMFMSNEIYWALERAGFEGALMDGRPWVLEWRQPTHLYHFGGNMKLLTRHYPLSDDVGYRFSNRGWGGWPLTADTYSHWIREAAGDVVVLGWDFETFGEHHWKDTGIFDFLRHLPSELRRSGIKMMSASEAIRDFGPKAHYLPLPEFPATWAGEGGVWFFLGNSAQQAVFQLMHHAYSKALLTEDENLIDLACWLCQSDNLHLIQWFGRFGSEAEVSAYFTPQEWWGLGPGGIIWEIQCVYKNFIRALDGHVALETKPAAAAAAVPGRV